MERIIVNYKDGNIKEFQEPSGQIISGDNLIITTKKTISDENSDETHIATTSEVINLSLVKNFVKISETRKVNIEEYVSDK
jgi:hypothetical protein